MTLKDKLTAWYNAKIVKAWYMTWTVWAALAAAAIPDLMQIGLDNLDLLVSATIPLLDDTNKARLQLAMILLIPIVRSLKQKNLAAVPVAEKTENVIEGPL